LGNIEWIVSDEKAALKKLQDLSDRLDKARESQRAAAKQVEAAKETAVRAKKAVVRVMKKKR